jgi:hypothetical protein
MQKITMEQAVRAYQDHGGNIQAAATSLGVGRGSIYHHLKKAGIDRTKKIVDGSVRGVEAVRCALPKGGKIKRYILTSAQNNTHVHGPVWNSLLALAKHYDAQIMVGTFTYNQNAFGKLSVKRGKEKRTGPELWYDQQITPFIVDERHLLANNLHWCGEMNILPTAVRPLTGFESYTGRSSAIFPQVKFAMESIATGRKENTKFNYTTGTVTQRNYIQKKEGLKAEFHHCYGAVIVEVDSDGNWWLRQLNSTDDGTIYDLDVVVENGVVYENDHVEAITWGDSHALMLLDESVNRCSQLMLDDLRPRYQFLHDIMAGSVTNHWTKKSFHKRFRNYIRSNGWNDLRKEFDACNEHIRKMYRDYCKTYIVDANHDRPWVERWLDSRDGLEDPKNAVIWLKLNAAMYEAMEAEPFKRDFNVVECACRIRGLENYVATFLREDQSFLITPSKIECGMHGSLGPNGARGNPSNLSKMGRKMNVGHLHKSGIHDGLYVAGVSCDFKSDVWYTRGPSSWSHSHIVTYPNGKRTIITVWRGKYRA